MLVNLTSPYIVEIDDDLNYRGPRVRHVVLTGRND